MCMELSNYYNNPKREPYIRIRDSLIGLDLLVYGFGPSSILGGPLAIYKLIESSTLKIKALYHKRHLENLDYEKQKQLKKKIDQLNHKSQQALGFAVFSIIGLIPIIGPNIGRIPGDLIAGKNYIGPKVIKMFDME